MSEDERRFCQFIEINFNRKGADYIKIDGFEIRGVTDVVVEERVGEFARVKLTIIAYKLSLTDNVPAIKADAELESQP